MTTSTALSVNELVTNLTDNIKTISTQYAEDPELRNDAAAQIKELNKTNPQIVLESLQARIADLAGRYAARKTEMNITVKGYSMTTAKRELDTLTNKANKDFEGKASKYILNINNLITFGQTIGHTNLKSYAKDQGITADILSGRNLN